MIAEEFAKGFEHEPHEYARLSGREWRSARDALIDPSIRWSNFFSYLIDDYLTGGRVDLEEAQRTISIYTGNPTRHMLRNATEATERATFYRPSLRPHLNRMNFHTINQEMTHYWHHLLNPDEYKPLDYIHISAIQTRLAINALRLVESRRHFSEKGLVDSAELPPQGAELDRSFVGRITELDAAVTLLEVIKQQPIDKVDDIIMVPAPSKYAAFLGKSSDFLLFDTAEWQAHGVQVKTRLVDAGAYDEAYVSLIDGIDDLGNFKLKELADGRVVEQPIPGLVSADFVLHNDDLRKTSGYTKIVEFKGAFGPLMHAREVARTMEPHMEYTDRVQKAAQKIGGRLIEALERDNPDYKKELDILPNSPE